jgi:hypothetical protein
VKRWVEIFLGALALCLVGCAQIPGMGAVMEDPPSTTVVPILFDPLLSIVPLTVAEAAKENHPRAITGRCICHASRENNIGTVCPNLTVTILNPSGRELSRTTTNGDFAFQVHPKETYLLNVISETYHLAQLTSGDVHLGDHVVLNLVR